MRIPPRIFSVTALAAALLVGGSVTGTANAAPQSVTAVAPGVTAARFQAAAVGEICYSALPSQAHDTLELIDKGGPYPYPQDGTVFQNREGILPKQNTGYYHEFTVRTPGSSDRGARRIVTGDRSQEDYYTADHYRSFDLVDHGC
ncbi:ribonuclease domain-containing protein [Streptomyces aureocirculatus]|uniref:ribonuclease domain-containing protein n=1 Tax=Streptomyces aureocirculatus TaxID=67275 RepID=UPI0004CABC4A|nr:ribonuclease domain-containing protein [Streptomyces aureocirculatus]